MVSNRRQIATSTFVFCSMLNNGSAFSHAYTSIRNGLVRPLRRDPLHQSASAVHLVKNDEVSLTDVESFLKNGAASTVAACFLGASLAFGCPAWAENELSDRYGGGFDSSLVDQTCLVDKCSLQAKACLADDPSCRKGLTCTAKCLGDNYCITGCMARYGNKNLDNLLKCTIEDNDCIKVAILPGGADKFGEEPRAPTPTVQNFNPRSLEGSWYKVVGYNPNYDCYTCQRNSFSPADSDNFFTLSNKLRMDVEFSMPYLLPDGSPPPPKNVREIIQLNGADGSIVGSAPIALNAYSTHETMVFDKSPNPLDNLVMKKATGEQQTFARTAHSEGEMFGLKFWENWYVIGENDPDQPEFKFIYYNGKTRQNTYDGAFVYSRTQTLDAISMKKVYKIAKDAGMNPDNFCSIRNGCFKEVDPSRSINNDPFRGFLASTKISQLLGVESVAAEDSLRGARTAEILNPERAPLNRAWWREIGDYLENPHRHFKTMDNLRVKMEWPEDVKSQD